MLLNSGLVVSFSELSESLGGHAHERSSLVTSKVNVNALCEVRDAGAEHIGWVEVCVCLATVLTPVASHFFDDLLAAVVSLASWVEDSVVILDLGYIPIQEEDVVLVHIVGLLK